VLFYPGTDLLFPVSSYGVDGPFASLRMKQWRRGLQDCDYLTLAAAAHPTEVQAIVNTIIPKVVWEVGVADTNDPTWVRTDISWSTDPDVWENARWQLANLIAPQSVAAPAVARYRAVRLSARQNGPSGRVRISWRVLDNGEAARTVMIVDAKGAVVRKWVIGQAAGIRSLDWDCRNSTGKRVAAGNYVVRLQGTRRSWTCELALR